MSDLFKDLAGKAKETLNPIVDRASDALEHAKAKAGELKESAASGELRDRAAGAIADVKEKAAPVIDKLKDATADAVDKVKDAATTVISGEKPELNIRNELFDMLDEEVAKNKDAAAEQAAEMQKRIEEMLGGKEDDE